MQIFLNSFPLHVPPWWTHTLTVFTVPRARVRAVEAGMFCTIPKHINAFLASNAAADMFLDSFDIFRARVVSHVLSVLAKQLV